MFPLSLGEGMGRYGYVDWNFADGQTPYVSRLLKTTRPVVSLALLINGPHLL